jgi:hypothetical protein
MYEECDDRHSFCIQGEIVGPGIQSNRYDLKKHAFFWFSVLADEKYMLPRDADYFMDEFCIPKVPEVKWDGVTPWLEFAQGSSCLLGKVAREGIVLKSIQDPNTRFKVISNKYLLKHG